MPLLSRLGMRASAVKRVPDIASGLLLVVGIVVASLAGTLVRVVRRRRHVREARRLGLDAGRLSWAMTGNNVAAPIALQVVSVREGQRGEVLATATAPAEAAGYKSDSPGTWWRRSERTRVYTKRGKTKTLSLLEVSAFVPGETIAGSSAVVPDGHIGLSFKLRASR
jgi:hypothetical protein